MDLKQIKLIIDLMKRSELTEFAIEEEGFKLKICRSNTSGPYTTGSRGTAAPFTTELAPAASATAPQAPAAPVQTLTPAASAEETGIIFVKSPMVGTFYRSASPDSKAFAEIGAKIVENSPVCIIEAMKIMNEIQSEVRGTIVEVLVENGQPVEYGQKLFKVKQG